jgi:predicted acylesterase/phospholipase RssA
MDRSMRPTGRLVVVAWLALLPACKTGQGLPDVGPPPPITTLRDAQVPDDTIPVLDIRASDSLNGQPVVRAGGTAGRQFNVLVLSGGGAYGAYSAGLLTGWTEAGTRPMFDVVTGVSTGALIAPLAFLGAEYDSELRKFYTTMKDSDVYNRRSDLHAVLSDAFAESKPLANLIDQTVNQALVDRIAVEHAKGRRLYVGTTHLESRRLVVWDIGAIASRKTEWDAPLIRRVLLASASIPGFFPPAKIPVEVDGKWYEELHVDGGVTASLFFRPPHVPKAEAKALGDRPLGGSNLYIVVAGKLYADPAPVENRLLSIVENSISALLYAQTRGDLFQLYALTLATGMNYRLAAVPLGEDAPMDATSFDPVQMQALFEVGRKYARENKGWRATPPGLQPGEEVPLRGGLILTTGEPGPKSDSSKEGPGSKGLK